MISANIESKLNEFEYSIDGYNCLKSNGNIARVACYVRSNLRIKPIAALNDNLASIWIEVGDGLNKWHICNYYREFRELGVPGSETLQAQKNRFETFLNSIENMERKNNTIILGDFNIDLTDENNTFIQLQQDFKDSLLNCLPLAGFTQIVKNPTKVLLYYDKISYQS